MNETITIPYGRQLMSRKEAAAYLHLSVGSLASDVCRPRLKIPFIRMGRVVVYDRADLDAWLTAHRVTP